jgi:hypothetical protein
VTRARAVTLLGNIHKRQEKPVEFEVEEDPDDENDDTNDAPPIVSKPPPKKIPLTRVSKYVSATDSKSMIKSYQLFESDSFDSLLTSRTTDEATSTDDNTTREETNQPRVILPHIGNHDPKTSREQTKIFIQTATPSSVSSCETHSSAIETKPSHSSKAKCQHTSSHSANRKSRERQISRRQHAAAAAPSPSSSNDSSLITDSQKKKLKSYPSLTNLPSLPPEQLSKYFGKQSKLIFFDTYRELHHLRDKILGGNREIDHYITLEQKDLDHEIDEISATQGKDWSNRSYHDENSTLMSQEEDDFQSDLISLGGSEVSSFFSPLKSSNFHFDEGSLSTMGSATEVSSISRSSFTPSSPRAKYLAGCIKNNVAPRSSLLLRDSMTSSLTLEHQGIGDKMGELLSTGLLDIPHITSVNIADNNLTDVSLTLILDTIAQRPSITELNLSRNKVGSRTAKALGDYLRHPSCTLKKLSMRASNVDDTECHQFVDALGYNRCLEVRSNERQIGREGERERWSWRQ